MTGFIPHGISRTHYDPSEWTKGTGRLDKMYQADCARCGRLSPLFRDTKLVVAKELLQDLGFRMVSGHWICGDCVEKLKS